MAPRLTPSEKALRTITEKEWQKSVTTIMTAYGWQWWHGADNRPGINGRIQTVKPGLPDLIAVRGKRVLFAELKRETGKTTPEQDQALSALGAAAEAYVWRPRDIAEVRRILMPTWAEIPPSGN